MIGKSGNLTIKLGQNNGRPLCGPHSAARCGDQDHSRLTMLVLVSVIPAVDGACHGQQTGEGLLSGTTADEAALWNVLGINLADRIRAPDRGSDEGQRYDSDNNGT